MKQDSHDTSARERQITVILLTSSYPRHTTDTASVFLRYLATHLHERDIAVHVLAPADEKTGTTVENGIAVTRFAYLPKRWRRLAYGSGMPSNLRERPLLWLQVPFFVMAMAWALFRAVRRAPRPLLVHAHWIIPQGIVATIIGMALRVPVVVTLHGADAFSFNHAPVTTIKRFCLNRCTAWTANTQATANAVMRDQLLPPPTLVPMGVDIDRFASGSRTRLRAPCEPDNRIILFVGRLVEKKGVSDLVSAFAQLPIPIRNTAIVWIVGHGHMKENLERLVGDLGLVDRIRFWGQIPNNQLPDFLAAADLFVGPSVEDDSGDTEGQGVVFLEAFAAGLTVIATRVGGIPEIVEHGVTGILVEPRNTNELAAVIQKLLQNADLRRQLGARARQKVQSFAWPRIAAAFRDLYLRVLETKQ